ncbi:MAG TPA: aldehyde dehydrogenase family protein [Candidatus Limnocylindrales bacterium]|jgi:succinate-semialdehyde dehydrogenase/glutarate-semialdehyde dehydrogenase
MLTERASIFIGGAWTDASGGDRFDAVNPATGNVIATIARGSRDDVERAMAAASDAFAGWARRSAFERAAAMERVADAIEARRDDLARTLTLDQGKPLMAEAYGEVEELIVYFRMAAAEATRLDGLMPPSVDANKRVLAYRVPRGVVGVITPWNWPYTMPGELIAPALAAGNTVVWNPASNTSLCATVLAGCLADADLPAGVFNLVTGPGIEVGDAIAADPRTAVVGFIGSSEAGMMVAARAAGKDQILEMGGNGPLVILDDADLEAAVTATLTAAFLNAGQSCTAGERILVQAGVHDDYLERLTVAVHERIRLGDPLDGATTMGPLNSEAGAAKMDAHVADALARGARLIAGGHRAPQHGSPTFYEATVLDDVDDSMLVAREETFGPIVPLTRIQDVDEALAVVNGSSYGLLTAIFTSDLGRGLRFAEAANAGWVNINEGTNYWESHLPFGGRAGSASGVGRVGGRFSMERFTELKTVILNLG